MNAVLWKKRAGSERGDLAVVWTRQRTQFYCVRPGTLRGEIFSPFLMESTGPSKGNSQNQTSREQGPQGRKEAGSLGWVGIAAFEKGFEKNRGSKV